MWLTRALGETAPDPAAETRFDDVSADDWWMPYVEQMAELEITVGCRSDPPRYCPDRDVNRAQMASFLARALDLPPAEPAGFADVDADGVHLDNINRLAAAQITVGCRQEPLRYCPQRSVTRAQMSAFIHRSLQWLKENMPDETPVEVRGRRLISNDTDEFITQENDFSRYIKENIVDRYGEQHPWIRATWNHTNRAGFSYVLGEAHGTAVYLGRANDEGGVLNRVSAYAVTANPRQLWEAYNPSHIHELAHIYTGSNRIVANPAPIGAGHLYFSKITGGECQPYELYAETAETLFFGNHYTQDNWVSCDQVPKSATKEATKVVHQAFRGQMPDWFYDTFQDSSGQLDYEAIWAAVNRIEDGLTFLAVVNQFRYSFGGYCFEVNGEPDIPEDFLSGQPWVDGGC